MTLIECFKGKNEECGGDMLHYCHRFSHWRLVAQFLLKIGDKSPMIKATISRSTPYNILLKHSLIKTILLLFTVSFFYLPGYGQSPDAKGGQSGGGNVLDTVLVDQSIKMIKQFSDSYRFGPGDVLAIRVKAQPDYTLERVKVSPMGTIFHPLLGDMTIAGSTLEQLKKQLERDVGEYIIDPVISLELVEAQSAKIAVVGEVKSPKIILMNGPITVLDAINDAGGFTQLGSRTNVKVSRLNSNGSRSELKVNIKKVLNGQSSLGENLPLIAGDTVIVHGNAMSKMGAISSFTNFASVLSLLQFGAR